MENKKTALKISLIIFNVILIIALVCVSAVYATWDYGYGANPYKTKPFIKMGKWTYESAEQPLPSDGVVDIITDETDTNPTGPVDPSTPEKQNTGLNNPDSALNKIITKRKNNGFDTFSSVDYYNGENIRSDLGIKPEDNFILTFPTNEPDRMYLYSTPVTTGENVNLFIGATYFIPEGERVYPVYKNTLMKNDKGNWISVSNEIGSAEVGAYESRVIGQWTTQCPIFKPETWIQGSRGTTNNDAIILYYGQTYQHTAKDVNTVTHFVIHGDGNRFSITAADTNTIITVSNANGKVIANSQNGFVEYKSKNKTDNFITVYGSTNTTLSISG